MPADIAAKLREIGPRVAPPQTSPLYAPLHQRPPYAGVVVTRDVAYGPHARNLLDVFEPANAGAPRPVLVFVHGGAFVAGNRRSSPDSPFYDSVMLWALANGMVGVNMTYRLAPEFQWPAAQQDIAGALRWIKANIAARGGDPQRIYLMGHSAGAAHVAQYVGHAAFHVEPGSGLAGAIMVSGLFDPVSATTARCRSTSAVTAAPIRKRSALPGLVASRVPMLFADAELDPPQFHAQNDAARAALCVAGRACPAFLRLLGHSHMSEIYAINTGDRALTDPIRRFVMR